MNYHLEIHTWAGMVPGAKHYYGSISAKSMKEHVDVTRRNKDGSYDTIRFDHEPEVYRLAKAWFKERAKPGDTLTVSWQGLCDPCRVLAAYVSPGVVKKANMIWRQTVKIGGWERAEERMKILCGIWEKLWAAEGVKTYE